MGRPDHQLVALGLLHAFNDGSLAVFLAALPVMRLSLNLSIFQIGTILSAGLLATVITQVAFGYLADVGFARQLLLSSFAALVIVDLAFVAGGEYWQVILLYVILRAAGGVYHPVSFSTIFRTAEKRSASMGFQSAFGDASTSFAMLSTGFIAESASWDTPFILWGVIGVICVIAFAALMNAHEKTGRNSSSFTLSPNSHSEIRISAKRSMLVQFSTIFTTCLYLVFTSFMALYLNINLQLSPGVSSLIVALWLAIGIATTFNAGRFVEFFRGEKKTLLLCFGSTTILLGVSTLLSFIPGLLILMLVPLVLSGIPYFLGFPVLYGLLGTTAPRSRLGLAYAMNLSLSLVAGSVVSYAVGFFASSISLVIVLPILAISAGAATLTVILL